MAAEPVSEAHRLRLRYSKTGGAKYISHLDLLSVIRRAFLRAGLNLKYSEGFNPHPYMSAALPLPVGCASVCELMDFGITGAPETDGIAEMISAVLPEGLKVREVYSPERKFSDIKWVEISSRLFYDAGAAPDASARLTDIFSADRIVVAKKSKRGVSRIDIAPFIMDVSIIRDDNLVMIAKVSAQDPTVSHSMLLDAISSHDRTLTPDFALFTRTEIFDADMKVFK